MIIRHVTKEMLDDALKETNKVFKGNIQFSRCVDHSTKRVWKWDVLLLTISSNLEAPGRYISRSGRRLPNCCWHVHGYFFNELLQNGAWIDAYGMKMRAPSDNWKDYPKGGGVMMSKCCKCEQPGQPWGGKSVCYVSALTGRHSSELK